MRIPTLLHMSPCRICSGPVASFLDLGEQPLSDAFLRPDETDDEFFFRLEVGRCTSCTMTQLLHEVPRERMFHADYPYRSSARNLRAMSRKWSGQVSG